jgi:hypothetical protein
MVRTTKTFLPILLGLGCIVSQDEPSTGSGSTENSDSAVDSGSSLGSTGSSESGGVGRLECMSPSPLELDVALGPPPPETGSNSRSFQGVCTVTSASGSPVSVALACDDPMGPLEFSLSVSGITDAAVPDALEVGASVELHYATTYGLAQSPAWAAIRLEGDASPNLVAVTSWQPLPWFIESDGFMSPIALEFILATDCEESQGSCNVGPRRRAAVEVSVDGGSPTVVFDRNQGSVDSYSVSVGHAEVDEGNCEGVNETWFEVVLIRGTGS